MRLTPLFLRLRHEAMALRTFYCGNCSKAVQFHMIAPDVCTGCGTVGKWRASSEPRTRYELTLNDRRFLKSIRVLAEEPSSA